MPEHPSIWPTHSFHKSREKGKNIGTTYFGEKNDRENKTENRLEGRLFTEKNRFYETHVGTEELSDYFRSFY